MVAAKPMATTSGKGAMPRAVKPQNMASRPAPERSAWPSGRCVLKVWRPPPCHTSQATGTSANNERAKTIWPVGSAAASTFTSAAMQEKRPTAMSLKPIARTMRACSADG